MENELHEAVRDRLFVELRERKHQLERDVAQIKQHAATRGAFNGSAMWEEISDRIRNEYNVRTTEFWQALRIAYTDHRIQRELKNQSDIKLISGIMDIIIGLLTESCEDLEKILDEALDKTDSHRVPNLDKLRKDETTKIRLEIMSVIKDAKDEAWSHRKKWWVNGFLIIVISTFLNNLGNIWTFIVSFLRPVN